MASSSALAANMNTLKAYLLQPPSAGWGNYFCGNRVGTVSGAELSGEIFDKLGEKLKFSTKVKEKLIDWAKEQARSRLMKDFAPELAEICEDGSPVGIAVKVAGYGTWCFKILTFLGHFSVDQPHWNIYNADYSPDEYVEYMIWCWKRESFRYECPKKYAAWNP